MAVQQTLRKLEMSPSLLILPTLALLFSCFSLWLGPSDLVCSFVLTVSASCVLLNLVQGILKWGRSVDAGWIIFNAAIFFWFLLPGVTRIASADSWNDQAALISAGPADFQMAFLIVNLFYFLFCTTYSIGLPRQLIRWVERRFLAEPSFQIHNNFKPLVILFICTLLFYILVSGGIGDALTFFTAGRSGARPWDSVGNYGTALSPFHNAVTSLRIAISIVFGYLCLRSPISRRRRMIAGALWVIAALSVVIESGTRTQLILCFGPPLLLYFRARFFNGPSSTIRALFLVFIVALILAFIGSFLRTYRNKGDFKDALNSSEVAFEDNDGLLHTAFAYQEMKLVPPTHDSAVLHILTGPFPRVLWPGKPEIQAMNVHSLYVWGRDVTRTGGNTLPYIPGQYLLAWGWLGLFEVGIFMGLFLSLSDNILARSRSPYIHIFCAVFSCYIFIAFRLLGFFFSFSLFIIFGAIQLQRWRQRKKQISR